MIRQGKLRGKKVQYTDGISCCIWIPLLCSEPDEYDEIRVDFVYDDIDDLIALLQQLKAAEAEVYQEPE